MHIIKFKGGLGNQLFQYALYTKFQQLGYEVRADLTRYKSDRYEQREWSLPFLSLNVVEAESKDILRFYYNEESVFSKVMFKLRKNENYYLEKIPRYTPEILDIKEGYFNGYWQTEKYFDDIRDIIRKQICFPELIKKKDQEIFQMISQDQYSVGVHIRLGDYLKLARRYGNICTTEYYCKAFRNMREEIRNPNFYVFSNDIIKAKDILKENNVNYIDNHSESEGYIDMFLMSSCRHQIIANSSFSWWAAWINNNDSKRVIAPSKWLNTVEMPDIVPDKWIKIS